MKLKAISDGRPVLTDGWETVRPANWFVAAGGPVNRWTQELITRRYFRAARRLAAGSA